MYRHFFLAIIGIILFFTLSFCALFVARNAKTKAENKKTELQSAIVMYKNELHGFKINYPQKITPEKMFTGFHEIGTSWRVHGKEDGQQVVEFPIYKVENMTTETGGIYPLIT